MKRFLIILSLFALMFSTVVQGEEDKPVPPAPAALPGLTVAVLDFTAKDPANPDMGQEIGEAVGAMLSGEPGFTLVDRSTLQRILQEQELNLTGLIDNDQAIKIGKLAGAKIMVAGRAFTLGKQMVITAKIIGTETSLVESVMVKADAEADLGELTVELSAKIAERLREAGPKLVAQPEAFSDPLPALRKKLAGRKLPVVAVVIREQHHAAAAAGARAVDPAVETEVKRVLIDAGFTVRDVPQNELTDFAKDLKPTDVNSWPRSLAKVEVLIVGQAFSEFAARVGNLVSTSARAEVNVIDRKEGTVRHADRTTTRGVDLSEQTSAKTALQKAGHALALQILQHFDDTLPQKKKNAGRRE